MANGSLYLVRGDDPTLIGRAVQDLLDALIGDQDRSLVVNEFRESDYRSDDGTYSMAPIVDAAQTPPFLTESRVVVGREVGRFAKADDLAALLRYLDDPLETTKLVLVWEKGPELQRLGALPKNLTAAAQTLGEVVDARMPRGKGARAWLDEQIGRSGLRISKAAAAAIALHVGEDAGRVGSLLETLVATYGTDDVIDVADVEPYLGEAGDVAPWELTDALANASIADAIDRLHRMQRAGGRHGIQILGSLGAHYGRMLRLDGSGISNEKEAARALGLKGSTFPAKKALQETRKLGSAKISRAIELLAEADLALRGATGAPDSTTMEVLVARLATLHRAGSTTRG